MRVSGPWLHAPASQSLMELFKKAGFQIYFVGGCVRNALIGAPVSDLDLSTDARPAAVLALAEDAGIKAIPTGMDHGTITLIHEGETFEVTTFRKDVATDGRRATVAFADSVEDDARRRDFTMNALYADSAGDIIDPVGGLTDLTNRRVIFIDDAEARVAEDYLRILRYFRFHAWYGSDDDGFDTSALNACARLSEGLETLSKERIGAETLKLLAAPDPLFAAAGLETTGCLARILPGATTKFLGPVISLTDQTDPILRLAALGGENPRENLRLSNPQIERHTLLRTHMSSSTQAHELAYKFGAEFAEGVLVLRSAMGTPQPINKSALKEAEAAVFPIAAKDLMPNLQGPALGKRLKELELAWITSHFCLSREELLERSG